MSFSAPRLRAPEGEISRFQGWDGAAIGRLAGTVGVRRMTTIEVKAGRAPATISAVYDVAHTLGVLSPGFAVPIGIIAIIVILFVIAGVIYYFAIRQQPTNVVMDAVVKAVQAKQVASEGTLQLPLERFDGQLDVTFSANKVNHDGSFDATVTYSSKTVKKPVTVKGTVIFAADGTLYLKANHLDKAIAAAYQEMGVLYNQMQMPGQTAQPFNMTAVVTNMGRYLSDRWIKFPVQAKDSKTSSPLACFQAAAAKFNANSTEREAIIDAYKQHDFLVIDDHSLPDEGSSDGYRLSVDQTKLSAFKHDVKQTTVGKLLAGCLDNADTTDMNRVASDASATTVDVWIDTYTHHITHIKTAGDDAALTMDIRLDVGADTQVTVPTEAQTMTELFSKSSLEAQAKQQATAKQK